MSAAATEVDVDAEAAYGSLPLPACSPSAAASLTSQGHRHAQAAARNGLHHSPVSPSAAPSRLLHGCLRWLRWRPSSALSPPSSAAQFFAHKSWLPSQSSFPSPLLPHSLFLASSRAARVICVAVSLYLLLALCLAINADESLSIASHLIAPFHQLADAASQRQRPYYSPAAHRRRLNLMAEKRASEASPLSCLQQLSQPLVLEHWLGAQHPSADTLLVPRILRNGSVVDRVYPSVSAVLREARAAQLRMLETAPLSSLVSAFDRRVRAAVDAELARSHDSRPPATKEARLRVELGDVVLSVDSLELRMPTLPRDGDEDGGDQHPAFLLTPSFLRSDRSSQGALLQHLHFSPSQAALRDWEQPLSQETAAAFAFSIPSRRDACIAVAVPHTESRSPWQPYPRFPLFGPDSLRIAMKAERTEGGYEQYVNFSPLLYPERAFSKDDEFLPFYGSAEEEADERQDGPLSDLRLQKTETTTLEVPVEGLSGAVLAVRATVTATLVVQFRLRFDLGFNLYVATAVMPPVYGQPALTALSAVSSASPFPVERGDGLLAPGVFIFDGVLEYSNWEWNPDPPLQNLYPLMQRIRYIDRYHILLQPSTPPQPLPICPFGNHSGYYATPSSPYAPPSSLLLLQLNVLNQSFYAHDCHYLHYAADAAFRCLQSHYPIIHWFGDSNTRRALRQLYTGNRWGEEVLRLQSPLLCEDQDELSWAGTGEPLLLPPRWPYPLPNDSAELCLYQQYRNVSFLRLPASTAEPLSCTRATGAAIYFRFLLGLGWRKETWEWFDYLMLVDYPHLPQPADLVVINLGNWESQQSVWDETQSGLFAGQEDSPEAAQLHNLTWKLDLLVTLLHDLYVAVNPRVHFLFRPGNAYLTPRGENIRRHTTQRLESISQRMTAHLLSSRLSSRFTVWDVQQTRAFTAHDFDRFDKVGAGCNDGHSGVRQVALDNHIMLNALCNHYREETRETQATRTRTASNSSRSARYKKRRLRAKRRSASGVDSGAPT